MNCSGYTEWIARKMDGLLPEESARALAAHLSLCPRCRAELLLQTRIHEALSRELPAGLSHDFALEVTRKALRDSKAERRARLWANLVPALAFAGGAVLLLTFRADLARLLPALVKALTGGLAAPVAWIGNAVLGFLAHLTDFPAEQMAVLEIVSRPLVVTVTATLLGIVPTFWAFYRIFAFLRD